MGHHHTRKAGGGISGGKGGYPGRGVFQAFCSAAAPETVPEPGASARIVRDGKGAWHYGADSGLCRKSRGNGALYGSAVVQSTGHTLLSEGRVRGSRSI